MYCVGNMQNSSLQQQMVRIATTVLYRVSNHLLEYLMIDIISMRNEPRKARKK
jgi:hypothetical protein